MRTGARQHRAGTEIEELTIHTEQGSSAAPGPLADVLVIDLSRALAGPHAAMMLADLGARVIKVESPGGDESRSWGPPFVGEAGISTYYLCCNRNKESVTADLKSPAGRDFLRRLVAVADVLIENFRPGVLDRLGFSAETLHQLNPGLVICSITGFGHDGPECDRPGYDQVAQGEAGLMSLTGSAGGTPTKVGVPIGDLLAGMNLAYGAVAALREREATGRGRVVRTSLLAALVGVHAFQGTRYTVAGETPAPAGNEHPAIAPYGLFEAADGPVQIACGSDATFVRLAGALGLAGGDPRFATNELRVRHREALSEEINRSLRSDSVDAWIEVLLDVGVAAGRVRTLDQVYAWEQTLSQGLVIDVRHPDLGDLRLPGPALRFDDAPYAGGRRHHSYPPRLGEHDVAVRQWLAERDASGVSAP